MHKMAHTHVVLHRTTTCTHHPCHYICSPVLSPSPPPLMAYVAFWSSLSCSMATTGAPPSSPHFLRPSLPSSSSSSLRWPHLNTTPAEVSTEEVPDCLDSHCLTGCDSTQCSSDQPFINSLQRIPLPFQHCGFCGFSWNCVLQV